MGKLSRKEFLAVSGVGAAAYLLRKSKYRRTDVSDCSAFEVENPNLPRGAALHLPPTRNSLVFHNGDPDVRAHELGHAESYCDRPKWNLRRRDNPDLREIDAEHRAKKYK